MTLGVIEITETYGKTNIGESDSEPELKVSDERDWLGMGMWLQHEGTDDVRSKASWGEELGGGFLEPCWMEVWRPGKGLVVKE